MEKIIIGIVEDDEAQRNSICRTLYSHFGKVEEYQGKYDLGFKQYNVVNDIQTLFNEISNDILNKKIDTIIVDYKIVSEKTNTNGVSIVDELKKLVREFPAIILTERENECINATDIDPDKIYSKKGFLLAKSPYSSNAAEKIFKNIFRFSNKRTSLINKIDLLKKQNDSNGELDNLDEILELERELSDYTPEELTSVEKILDKSELDNILNMIERANALLGD